MEDLALGGHLPCIWAAQGPGALRGEPEFQFWAFMEFRYCISIEDIVLYLVLAPQPRLTKTGIFRRTTAQSEESKPLPYLTGALAPPELVTASLSPMREKR